MSDPGKYTDVEVYCKATECGIGDKLYCSSLIGDLQEVVYYTKEQVKQPEPLEEKKHGIQKLEMEMKSLLEDIQVMKKLALEEMDILNSVQKEKLNIYHHQKEPPLKFQNIL